MKYLLIALCSVVLLPSVAAAATISGTFSGGVVTAPPTASPIAGTYDSTQTVTLAATSSSNIYYTTDGATVPVCGSVGTSYAGAIDVSTSLTLKTVSCYSNGSSSSVASFSYVIHIPPDPPTASPDASAGPFTSAQDITLSDASTTASIYYTRDDSGPYCGASTLFSSSSLVHLTSNATLKAVACTPTGTSTVATFSYVINIPAPAPEAPAASGGGNGPVSDNVAVNAPPPSSGGGGTGGGNAVIPTLPPGEGGVVLGTMTVQTPATTSAPTSAPASDLPPPSVPEPETQNTAVAPATGDLAAAAGLTPTTPFSSFGPILAALILALLLASWAFWYWLKSGTSH